MHANVRFGFLLTLFFLPKLILAQDDISLKPVSSTYAITNVNIVQLPGKVIEFGTVIIKDGLITSVGKNLNIPKEAIIIEADSMYLYAGFIDGLTHMGAGKSPDVSHKKPNDPGNPDPTDAGITPYRLVRDCLNPDDRLINDYRFIGFTAAQVVPNGVLMPGQGAMVVLGDNNEGNVLQSNTCFYSEFTSNRGVYPSTIMGIMAKWRELYKQAELNKSYLSVYASNRNGLPRPTTDRILESFYPIIDKKIPVVFQAESALDIYRALSLKQDLGFDLVLGNVKEGWDVIPKIKSSGAKIFLSLELPEALKKDTTVAADSEKGKLIQRKDDFIGKYVAQANTFNQAGLKFGFSSMGMKVKDIRPNLKRMIDAGFSEDAALSALTINAAELLGVADRMGSIEKGKMANMFICDKSYFDEKSNVKYVIVEGTLYTCWDSPYKKDVKDVIEGTWSMTTETPQGKKDLKVVFKKLEKDYKGKISEAQSTETININSATYKNGKLRFVYSVKFEGTAYDIVVEGTIEGEVFKGSMNVGNYGSFPMDGKKDPKI